jgi:hypothetical protein
MSKPELSFTPVPIRTRHNGWTPDRIATFLETLADTGLVIEGYRAAGMSKQAATTCAPAIL